MQEHHFHPQITKLSFNSNWKTHHHWFEFLSTENPYLKFIIHHFAIWNSKLQNPDSRCKTRRLIRFAKFVELQNPYLLNCETHIRNAKLIDLGFGSNINCFRIGKISNESRFYLLCWICGRHEFMMLNLDCICWLNVDFFFWYIVWMCMNLVWI